MRHLCPIKYPELPTPFNELQSVSPEERLRLQEFPQRHDKDAIGWLREVSLQEPSNHQIIKILIDVREVASPPPALSAHQYLVYLVWDTLRY